MAWDKTKRISLEEGVKRIQDADLYQVSVEQIELLQALGRVAAADLAAEISVPSFDRSAFDGYAVRRRDVEGAGVKNPACLSVTKTMFAGDSPQGILEGGAAMQIMTGAPIPKGADCVIPQEWTDQGQPVVQIYAEPSKDNICKKGEILKRGNLLIQAGTRLQAVHLGLLASQGVCKLPVYKAVSAGIMAVGDELVPCDQLLQEGQIYDSNSIMLAARMEELGGQALIYQAAADDLPNLTDRIGTIIAAHPLVITTGGVSVGAKDYVPEAARAAGITPLFHGVLARPGSPVFVGVRGGHIFLALSGNPCACKVMFEFFGRMAFNKISGIENWKLGSKSAILGNDYEKPSPIRRLLQGRLDGPAVFLTDGNQGVIENCLVDIPSESGGKKRGDEVRVWML